MYAASELVVEMLSTSFLLVRDVLQYNAIDDG